MFFHKKYTKTMGKEKYRTLDQSLKILTEKTQEKPSLSIQEILDALSGRGRFFVLLFLSFPFCQPLQIPGMAIPFGILISLIGLRFALGKGVCLPKKLLVKRFSSKKIEKILNRFFKIMKKMKRFIHPRLKAFCGFKGQKVLNGCLFFLLGILLALPLPIPLSNLSAGWAIFLLSLGVLKDDGLLVLLGYSVTLLTCLFFLVICWQVKWFFQS